MVVGRGLSKGSEQRLNRLIDPKPRKQSIMIFKFSHASVTEIERLQRQANQYLCIQLFLSTFKRLRLCQFFIMKEFRITFIMIRKNVRTFIKIH